MGSHRYPSPKLVSQVKQVAISKNVKYSGVSLLLLRTTAAFAVTTTVNNRGGYVIIKLRLLRIQIQFLARFWHSQLSAEYDARL